VVEVEDNTNEHSWQLTGPLFTVADMIKGMGAEPPPLRAMGGWVTTYGTLGPDGGIIPTKDREGHTFEAARQLGLIDWTGYLTKGVGIWTHNHKGPRVGIPQALEYHDGSTHLSQLHRKVGFWTRGHLFEEGNEASWAALGKKPTKKEFEHADQCWELADLEKGSRGLGFSVEGKMRLSRCKSRILKASVVRAALLEFPHNPDATAEAMAKGLAFDFLRKGMLGREECGKCSCPADGCEVALAGQEKPTQTGPARTESIRQHPRFRQTVGAYRALGYNQAAARVERRVRAIMERHNA